MTKALDNRKHTGTHLGSRWLNVPDHGPLCSAELSVSSPYHRWPSLKPKLRNDAGPGSGTAQPRAMVVISTSHFLLTKSQLRDLNTKVRAHHYAVTPSCQLVTYL